MTAPRFDGAAVWASLTPEAQAEIGAVALELVCAWWCEEQAADPHDGSDPLLRAAGAADIAAIDLLLEAFVAAVPRERLTAGDGAPLVPSLIGPYCRACGCTQRDACFPACSWAEEDLCSACVGGAR